MLGIMNLNSRIPASKLEKINCPFCGSNNAEKYREIADIARCNSCNAIYLRTRLNESTLEELYQSYADTGSHMDPPANDIYIKTSPLRREKFLNELLDFHMPEGLLLDIGCGWGAFIENAREKGFSVKGFELTERAAGFGIEKLNLDISTGQFYSTPIADNSVSVVTMIHTLEHMVNPREILDKIHCILKPGGIFCGIIPNIKSFASEILTDQWEWIDPYHHIVHFYPDFLERKLADAGFEIKKMYTQSGDFNKAVLRELVKEKYALLRESDIMEKINEISAEGKGEEIVFFASKILNDDQLKHLSPDNGKVIIDYKPGDDLDKIMFDTVRNMDGPADIVINDPENALPDYASNWNGVTIIRGERNNQIKEIVTSGKENIQTESEMNSETMNRLKFENKLDNGFANQKALGKMPSPLPSPLYLNLGCGNDIRDGFVNIDLFSDDPRVIYMDIRKLEMPDESADMILASDILEHFSHRETDNLLKEWCRVLKPGGDLLIRCPSLKLQVKAYNNGDWDADIASYMIFGGQTNPGDYHCVAFDEASIRKHLENSGFEIEKIEEDDIPQDKGYINLNMTVKAKKKIIEKENIGLEIAGGYVNNQGVGSEPVALDEDFLGFDFTLDDEEKETPAFETTPQIISNEPKQEKEITFEQVKDDILEALGKDDESEEIDDIELPVADSREDVKLNIVWEGSQFVYHSLALINREHCANLIDAGQAELTIIPYENEQFTPENNEKYLKLYNHDIRFKKDVPEENKNKPYVWIRHQWPPKAEPPKGAKWIIMQPWEFSTLRQDFADLFKQADEVWVPSNYNRQAYLNSGLDFNKVQVIPNGIDPELFKPSGEKYNLTTNKKLKFLFVGGTIFRKGIDLLLKSYIKTFTADDDVCLVIKDMGGDSFYKGQNAKDYIDKVRLDPKAPEILYIEDYLTEKEMASLYRACDIFTCTYRGEGFSLPTLEAMACGLPVVVTEGGATDDFVDESTGWLIPAVQKSIGTVIDNVPMTGEAFLLEPDTEAIASLLRSLYADPADITIKAIAASTRARSEWTWKKSTMKLLKRLDVLYGTDMAKKSEDKLKDSDDGLIALGRADEKFDKDESGPAMELYGNAIDSGLLNSKWELYALHKSAWIAYDEKDYEKAEEYLAKAEKIYPKHPDTQYIRAKIHASKEEWTESLEILTEIFDNWVNIKFDSTLGYSLDGLLCATAEGFYNQSDMDNALKLYTEALKYNNNNAEACLGAARCFMSAGAKGQALEMLEWAVKINPEYKEAVETLNKLKE